MLEFQNFLILTGKGREASDITETDSEMRIRLRVREGVSKREMVREKGGCG